MMIAYLTNKNKYSDLYASALKTIMEYENLDKCIHVLYSSISHSHENFMSMTNGNLIYIACKTACVANEKYVSEACVPVAKV